ncbi:MAG: phosphate acyltransferase PlsX [Pseudomonadota bacterium]
MTVQRTIALDVMGGDHGPAVVIEGASISLIRQPNLRFVLVGDPEAIEKELVAYPKLKDASTVVVADSIIEMDAKPSQAVRRGKGSSMWVAVEQVVEGEADAVVSAGNTGALMAISKLLLRPLGTVDRPAIAALWPTTESECVVLDVGANIGASSQQLCDFAMMGAAMARAVFGVERPTVGLLNVGTEDVKGGDEVRDAHETLRALDNVAIDYRGFVEGDQIGFGTVDVVVVEGFAGNIALKTAEGTAKQIGVYLRQAMTRSVFSRIGAFFARGGFAVLKSKMDPRRINGGTFLGLNGLAIKSHGGTDALGFASAIDLGYDMACSPLLERMAVDLETLHGQMSSVAATG